MINIGDIYRKLVNSGNDWAHKNAAADILEETTKSILSQLILERDGSMALREAEARADTRFTNHLAVMVEARRDANLAKVKWEAQKMYAELCRTKAASERAAMKEAT